MQQLVLKFSTELQSRFDKGTHFKYAVFKGLCQLVDVQKNRNYAFTSPDR